MPAMNRHYLASAPIWRALVHLCVPMIAGLSVGVVYNIMNAGFIGSLHSTPLLAALTFALPVLSLLMAVGGVFGVGGGTYVSRLLGSLDDPGTDPVRTGARIAQVASFTIWGSIAGGVLIGLAGVFLAGPVATAIGASGPSHEPTALYVTAMFAFAPMLVAAFALEQLVRAEGAAVACMTGLIASTIANLVFDVIFILGLGWGVLGAGLALGLSNLVTVGWYAWWISRRSTSMSLSLRHIRVDRELLRTVFGVGASELLMSTFLIVTTLVMNWIAIGYGESLLAAMGVALRIAQLPEMICMGIFMGAIPLFAYAFGARNHARLRAAIVGSAAAIALVTVLFSSAVFLVRDQVVALFSADPAVLTDGAMILTAMLVATVVNGFTGLMIAVFQATEQIRNATIMAVAQGAVFIPVVFVADALFGLDGVVWAMTVTELMTFGLGLALFVLSRRALEAAPSREAEQAAHEVDLGSASLDLGSASVPLERGLTTGH